MPLAPLTTIGIGGPARWLVEPASEEQLREILQWCATEGCAPLILGGGSNVLISDEGWPGIVIKNAIGGIELICDGDSIMAIAGGGVDWDSFVEHTVNAGLQGIECLSGIPGTVGASPVQNIGAYGQEVKETIAWVDVLERSTGKSHRFRGDECGFSYRWSRFKGDDRDKYVVTRVAFRLQHGAAPQLRYADIVNYFEERGIKVPTLAQTREAVLHVRAGKGMVISPDIPDCRSCGSFFMNPIVPEPTADKVYEKAVALDLVSKDEKMPRYPADPGHAKLSAAWLMERSGLRKGQQFGGVGLSSRHVLAIINRGGGTAAEVVAFARQIQNQVKDVFGVELHPEPIFVGFHNDARQEKQS